MPQSAKLTARFVQTVSEPGKYYDQHGLFLRVLPAGSKQWVQRVTINGKRKELGLGSASLVSLSEARDKAFENRRSARSGGDPLQAKREAQAVMTFEEAAREVHRIHLPTWRNKKHAAQFISTLETYAFPKMGGLNVSKVTTADVLAVLTPIWTEKPETASRVKQLIGTVMKWAIAQGWRQDDPAANIAQALPKRDKRVVHRTALPYDQVGDLLHSLDASQAALSTKLALELLILTAVRSIEARGARWEEFDLSSSDGAVWLVPDERTKMKRPHRVPLSDRATAIIEQAKALTDDSGLVFPGTKYGQPLSDNTLLKLVRELGYPVDVHGFRTSFKTWAQECTSHPREVSEAALAHVIKDKSEAAYARSDLLQKRRELMDDWALFVRGVVQDKAPE